MTYTRTTTEQGFRIVDWNEDDPKDLKHLLKMTHSPVLKAYLNCYDDNGIFVKSNIPSVGSNSVLLKYNDNLSFYYCYN